MLRSLIAIVVIFFISACSMPETKVYNLYVQVEKSPDTPKGDAFVVIRVDSPRYLAQPYIAYRNSPYQMEISRYSKWESSPKVMTRRALKDSVLSTGLFKDVKTLNITPKGFYVLDINLRRFERLDEGKEFFGELAFDVVFTSPEGKVLYHDTVSKKIKLDDQNFLSLARGLSDVLNEAIKEVKNNIVRAYY